MRFGTAAAAAEPAEAAEPECAWEAHAQQLRDEEAACNAKVDDNRKTEECESSSFLSGGT